MTTTTLTIRRPAPAENEHGIPYRPCGSLRTDTEGHQWDCGPMVPPSAGDQCARCGAILVVTTIKGTVTYAVRLTDPAGRVVREILIDIEVEATPQGASAATVGSADAIHDLPYRLRDLGGVAVTDASARAQADAAMADQGECGCGCGQGR
jgi:hypothetical protein